MFNTVIKTPDMCAERLQETKLENLPADIWAFVCCNWKHRHCGTTYCIHLDLFCGNFLWYIWNKKPLQFSHNSDGHQTFYQISCERLLKINLPKGKFLFKTQTDWKHMSGKTHNSFFLVWANFLCSIFTSSLSFWVPKERFHSSTPKGSFRSTYKSFTSPLNSHSVIFKKVLLSAFFFPFYLKVSKSPFSERYLIGSLAC